jgi:hypothetical protein
VAVSRYLLGEFVFCRLFLDNACFAVAERCEGEELLDGYQGFGVPLQTKEKISVQYYGPLPDNAEPCHWLSDDAPRWRHRLFFEVPILEMLA